jgi:uncharacterized phage-associated protein
MPSQAIHFKTSYDKIIETIILLASKKPGIDIYHLAKVLFFADKLHVNKYFRPVTTDTYIKLPYGPVPSTAYDIIKGNSWLSPNHLEKISITLSIGGKETHYRTKALREPDLSYFSKSDLECLEEAMSRYGDLSFDELYVLSHAERCYYDTEDKDKIDYALLITEDNPYRDVIIDHMREISHYVQV